MIDEDRIKRVKVVELSDNRDGHRKYCFEWMGISWKMVTIERLGDDNETLLFCDLPQELANQEKWRMLRFSVGFFPCVITPQTAMLIMSRCMTLYDTGNLDGHTERARMIKEALNP